MADSKFSPNNNDHVSTALELSDCDRAFLRAVGVAIPEDASWSLDGEDADGRGLIEGCYLPKRVEPDENR